MSGSLRIPSWPWPVCTAEIYDAEDGGRRLCAHPVSVALDAGDVRSTWCENHGRVQARATGGELLELEKFEEAS